MPKTRRDGKSCKATPSFQRWRRSGWWRQYRLGCLEPMREMCLNGRPLTIENAVHAGVAQRAVARDHVLTQYPVQSCAQPLNGRTALLIEKVSSEFHGNAIEVLERMRQ